MLFRDREHAGRLLAAKLERCRAERPIVLGLTRGGVPVAFEVARFLGAPLDVIVIRKIDAPGSSEYAVGAIAEGGATYVNPTVLREAGLRDEDAAALAEWEAVELARRVRLYRDERPSPHLAGRTAIVVDDGVVTGASARAAGRAARQRGAAPVVIAAPVIAARTEPELRCDFDEVVALERPPRLHAVSDWYERFDEVSDEAVLTYLRRARIELPANEPGGELWNGEWIGADPLDPRGKR